MRQPGQSVRRVAARLFTDGAMSRIIDPVIADWQVDYAEAVAQHRLWRGRWVWFSGYGVLLKTLALYGWWCLCTLPRHWSATDRGAVSRMVGITAAVTVALIVLVAYNPISTAPRQLRPLLAYLIPQAIPIAAPIGLAFGILFASWGTGLARRVVIVGLVAAVAVSVGSFVLVGTIIPSANQAFRVAAFRRLNPNPTVTTPAGALSRGRAELTLADLHGRVNDARQRGLTYEARVWAFDYYQRYSLACAALPLAVFALVVGTRRRFGVVALGAAGVGVTILYYLLMRASSAFVNDVATPLLVVWLPHVGVLMLSAWLAFGFRSSSTPHPDGAAG